MKGTAVAHCASAGRRNSNQLDILTNISLILKWELHQHPTQREGVRRGPDPPATPDTRAQAAGSNATSTTQFAGGGVRFIPPLRAP